MDKKKLVLYCISIIAAVAVLLLVLNFARGLLKTVSNNQNKTEADTIADKQKAADGDKEPDDINDENTGVLKPDETPDVIADIPAPEAVNDTEDPQEEGSSGINIDVSKMEKNQDETDDITYGIDVAKWQGIIDWAKVKEAGIEFAMIRVGYRTQVSGEITEDPYARYNLQEAGKHDIKIGIYFFSSAVNKKEAKEEAKWVTDFIATYKITYPVVYNCEGFTDSNNRQFTLTKEERTSLAIEFLDYVKEKGYTPMFYASKNELEDGRDWDTDLLEAKYKIWVAQYPDTLALNSKSTYSGSHDMWQYTNNGQVPGIKGFVDLNIAYFGYEKAAEPKDNTPVEEVSADPLALIRFREVNETVTAKEVTNLRDIPGTDTGSKVIKVLNYGELATRTGIGDNGWSRVEYEGQILYAVTDYLTTNLSYKDEVLKPTLENPEAGIAFTEVNEKVTAKIVTNLRLVPSADSDDTIAVALENGQIATRTGLGSNGWSRVEYEGQTLYAVSNYLQVVDEE